MTDSITTKKPRLGWQHHTVAKHVLLHYILQHVLVIIFLLKDLNNNNKFVAPFARYYYCFLHFYFSHEQGFEVKDNLEMLLLNAGILFITRCFHIPANLSITFFIPHRGS